MKPAFSALLGLTMAAVPLGASADDDIARQPLRDLAVLKVYSFPFEELADETTITRHTYEAGESVYVVTRESGHALAMATFKGEPAPEVRTLELCRYTGAWSPCRNGDQPVGRERVWSTAGKTDGWFVVQAVAENDPRNIKTRMIYIR